MGWRWWRQRNHGTVKEHVAAGVYPGGNGGWSYADCISLTSFKLATNGTGVHSKVVNSVTLQAGNGIEGLTTVCGSTKGGNGSLEGGGGGGGGCTSGCGGGGGGGGGGSVASIELEMHRYRHTETWQSTYNVDLLKFDAETGKPLEGSKWDILEYDTLGQWNEAGTQLGESYLDHPISEASSIGTKYNWANDNGSQFIRWEDEDTCDRDVNITGPRWIPL